MSAIATVDISRWYRGGTDADAVAAEVDEGLQRAGFIVVTDPPGPWSGLGLYVAAALYLAFYMRWVGRHHWLTVIGLSVVVPVVAFVIFEQWFLVPMPKGPLEDWLGY